MTNRRILLVVKTYPVLSQKHGILVCSAGIDMERKEWVRIYPIKFFDIPFSKRIHKYDIIEVGLEKAKEKFSRKESHKITSQDINVVGHIDTYDGWKERNSIILPLVKKSVEELDKLKESEHVSLGIIKPKKILSFKIEPISSCRDWEKDLVSGVQKTLGVDKYISPIEKIPLRFSYICDKVSF